MLDDSKQEVNSVTRELAQQDTSQGLVVGVDGVDGAGKTSLVAALAKTYGPQVPTIATKPFGGLHDVAAEGFGRSVSVSQVLCDLALNATYRFDDVERQLALTVCVRRHERVVVPALRAHHELVLTDRSVLSAAAYSAATGERLGALVDWAVRAIAIEDVIFWLDVDPATAFARRRRKDFATREGSDTVSSMGIEYQQQASLEFGRLALENDNVIRIDASKSAEAVWRDVVSILNPMVLRR